MELKLSGKTVLITGGSKGIGFATALAFAAEGCQLHLAARTLADLETARDTLAKDFAVPVTLHAVDLSRLGSASALVEACGDVDILVNNAGAVPGGSIEDVDEQRWRVAWDLKVFGYINTTREMYERMKKRGRGVIVNIIGNAGNLVPANYIAGVTGSAGLAAFTRALGGVSMDHGVRVVGISPGDCLNERGIMFLRQQALAVLGDAERWREQLQDLPGHRAAELEEIAYAAVFLSSDRSAYTSGAVLTIDGGISSRLAVL
jgi:NAD(P)-dependent dehydrogenase (short-subunit alcohol dehydrogenase family)